ncbi:MAG: hypothetical protein WCP45_15735 [Verrucomicrobiota bacterium]
MGFFNRFRKPKPEMDDCDHLSGLGDDAQAWDNLDDDELKQVIAVKFIEYGATQDSARIAGLFALYRYAMGRLDPEERAALLTEFSGLIEQNAGLGHMGLMMFLACDNDPGIRSSAALSLSVLFEPTDGDELAGPRFVIHTLVRHDRGAVGQGAALGGVLLLGDKRIMPLLEDVWDQLSEEAQLEMTQASSGFVSEGIIDFWLGRLESGCSEAVFGSVVAAIARMPASAQAPYVLDMERLLPAYAGGEPMKLLRRTAFADYLEAIRPRLKALEANESWPKVIPRIFEMWEDAEAFCRMAG